MLLLKKKSKLLTKDYFTDYNLKFFLMAIKKLKDKC